MFGQPLLDKPPEDVARPRSMTLAVFLICVNQAVNVALSELTQFQETHGPSTFLS